MSLVLVQDCREKAGKHQNITNYCAKIGLPIVRKMLNVGDYRLAEMDDNGGLTYVNNIAVDVKGLGRQELASDLYRDKLAFNKKYKKCLADGIKLIVLVEEPIKSLSELVKWKPRYGKVNGRYLLDLINVLKVSYGIEFYFCEKSQVGKVLLQLLSKPIDK